MRLLLVRHARTDGNAHRYVGREDLPLNAAGRRQVLELVHGLRHEAVAAVFSSPLVRAWHTAEPLARSRNQRVAAVPGLMEIDYGALAGTAKGAHPFRLRKTHLHTPMPGGESVEDVWVRLGPVVAQIRGALRTGTTVVVGHYWSNRLLLARLAGLPLEQALDDGSYKPQNASALAVTYGLQSPADTDTWHEVGREWAFHPPPPMQRRTHKHPPRCGEYQS